MNGYDDMKPTVARLWAPGVSPDASINFTGEIFHGEEMSVTLLAAPLCGRLYIYIFIITPKQQTVDKIIQYAAERFDTVSF